MFYPAKTLPFNVSQTHPRSSIALAGQGSGPGKSRHVCWPHEKERHMWAHLGIGRTGG
jgi:hypothetical protein